MFFKQIATALIVAVVVFFSFVIVESQCFNYLVFEKVNDSNNTLTPGFMEVLRFNVEGEPGATEHEIFLRIRSNFRLDGRLAELYDKNSQPIASTFVDKKEITFRFNYDFDAEHTNTFYIKVDLTDGYFSEASFQLNLVKYKNREEEACPTHVKGLPIIGNRYVRPF